MYSLVIEKGLIYLQQGRLALFLETVIGPIRATLHAAGTNASFDQVSLASLLCFAMHGDEVYCSIERIQS